MSRGRIPLVRFFEIGGNRQELEGARAVEWRLGPVEEAAGVVEALLAEAGAEAVDAVVWWVAGVCRRPLDLATRSSIRVHHPNYRLTAVQRSSRGHHPFRAAPQSLTEIRIRIGRRSPAVRRRLAVLQTRALPS